MTEKRFIDNGFEAIEEQSFTDTETDKTYYIDYFDEIIDLVNGLNEKNKVLYIEIKRLKRQNEDILYNNAKNMELLEEENEQLKTQIKIFEKFLDENNLDIDWEIFCIVDECKKDSDDYGCKECEYLGDIE